MTTYTHLTQINTDKFNFADLPYLQRRRVSADGSYEIVTADDRIVGRITKDNGKFQVHQYSIYDGKLFYNGGNHKTLKAATMQVLRMICNTPKLRELVSVSEPANDLVGEKLNTGEYADLPEMTLDADHENDGIYRISNAAGEVIAMITHAPRTSGTDECFKLFERIIDPDGEIRFFCEVSPKPTLAEMVTRFLNRVKANPAIAKPLEPVTPLGAKVGDEYESPNGMLFNIISDGIDGATELTPDMAIIAQMEVGHIRHYYVPKASLDGGLGAYVERVIIPSIEYGPRAFIHILARIGRHGKKSVLLNGDENRVTAIAIDNAASIYPIYEITVTNSPIRAVVSALPCQYDPADLLDEMRRVLSIVA